MTYTSLILDGTSSVLLYHAFYIKSKTIFKPSSTFFIILLFNVPTNSLKYVLSIVINCEILITDSFGKCESNFHIKRFPGAFAILVFVVITAQIIVCILLLLKISDWIIRTGRT